MMQRFIHPADDIRLVQFLDAQGEGYVLKNIHMRPDRKGLEYHTQSPFFRRNIQILFAGGYQPAAQFDLTFCQILKSGNHAQGG